MLTSQTSLLFIQSVPAGTAFSSLMELLECLNAGDRNLLVFVRLHSGRSYSADTLALIHDWHPAADQYAGWEIYKRGPFLGTVLEKLARPPGDRRGAGFTKRSLASGWSGNVHAFEAEQITTDRNPVVLDGLGYACRKHFLYVR
jgi:hypothetical protein